MSNSAAHSRVTREIIFRGARMEMKSGPYILTQGILYFSSGRSTVKVCAEADSLAVLLDRESGVLHKHGEENCVIAEYDRMRTVLASSGHEDMASDLEVIAFGITVETVQELNDCIATTGRVLMLKRRLKEMALNSAAPTFQAGRLH